MDGVKTTAPVRVDQILNPYPERSGLVPGVRVSSPVDVAEPDGEHITERFPPLDLPVFAASVKPALPPRLVAPWASLLLSLAGFLALGVAAVSAAVTTTTILGVWSVWTVCSLLLVSAQCMAIRSGATS